MAKIELWDLHGTERGLYEIHTTTTVVKTELWEPHGTETGSYEIHSIYTLVKATLHHLGT